MSAIHWSIALATIDLVSLYFCLLWYHSILKGSIDQYNEIHSLLACSRLFPWFPDLSRPYRRVREAWKRGNICSVSVSFVRVGIQIHPHVGRRKIQISPSPGEQDRSNALPQGQKDNQIPTPCPACPPAGFTLIGASIARPPNKVTSYAGYGLRFTYVHLDHALEV